MSEQLHALTAVLPGKWAISHCKQGWVGPRAGPDRYEKISCPPPGFKSDCPTCNKSLHHLRYRPCLPSRGCWYVYGKQEGLKIIKL